MIPAGMDQLQYGTNCKIKVYELGQLDRSQDESGYRP
jgi:hypothetical protein